MLIVSSTALSRAAAGAMLLSMPLSGCGVAPSIHEARMVKTLATHASVRAALLRSVIPPMRSATQQDFVKTYADKLPDSTKRAKWIESTDEHADRDGQTLATRDHEVIKRWAEERKAQPATVAGTEHGDDLGVLRFDFDGYGGDKLEPVSWDEWFKTFDDRKLVFLYQETKSDGQRSNFFRFDSPLREDG